MEAEIKKLEQMILNGEEYNKIVKQSQKIDNMINNIMKSN